MGKREYRKRAWSQCFNHIWLESIAKKLEGAQMPRRRKKIQHANSGTGSDSSSSDGQNQANQEYGKSKIDYNFSQKTLNSVKREIEE